MKFFNYLRYLAQRITKGDVLKNVRRAFGLNAGVFVTEDSAMQVSSFHRGVTYISTQLAKLPWEVKDAKNNILSGNVSNLINLAPNEEMNSFSFRLFLIQNALIHGNGYAEIERNTKGEPISLWPIPTENVNPVRTKDGKLVYKIMGGSADGSDAYLRPSDMFHLKNFHTKDGILGQGIVAYAKDVLGISIGADRMAGNLFANGGIPSGALEVDGVLSDEGFKRIKEGWMESHGGKKSAGIAVLDEGAKFKAINLAPDVLQFLESRKFSVLEVARFLGLPPTKLFDTSAATYSNTENANLEVATDTLDAWAKNLEMEADIKLLRYRFGGRRTELDLYQIFRGDMTTRSNYFSKMMQTSSITPNEIRQMEGKAGYDGGDRHFLAVNNYSPVDRVDEIIDAQISKSKGSSSKNPADSGVKNEVDDITKAVLEYLKRD